MELVKQIKEAEAKAKQIVEQSRRDAAQILEESKVAQEKLTSAVWEDRKKAIAEAISQAEETAGKESEMLRQGWQQQIQQLQAQTASKIEPMVQKIMSKLNEL